MTDDQHREVGRLLGFPECCIEDFLDRIKATTIPDRGVVVERYRTVGEAFANAAAISALLGERWPFNAQDPEDYARSVVSDLRKAYVPCLACDGPWTPGWRRA